MSPRPLRRRNARRPARSSRPKEGGATCSSPGRTRWSTGRQGRWARPWTHGRSPRTRTTSSRAPAAWTCRSTPSPSTPCRTCHSSTWTSTTSSRRSPLRRRPTFLTATTAARHMVRQRSGVVVLLSSTAARESRHRMGGFNLACASVEALVRGLAGEVGRQGVRVVGLRPNFTPETAGAREEDLPELVDDTLLGRLPRLAEVAGAAVFLASDAAGASTGTVLDLSCGAIVS
ncbi:SDR family NAD(P)-dependent oxidoreductase [Cellulosimicrobium cellulans]|uniref:SDR family NAD(P)-dependent oxidoreductase n=1 Tax=Cellulosimicrobium cellulans TaxID=1710 RepID=UPI0009F2430F|nr:SDR family oxidoreductase [Cellulosimicrobium cellulans]